MSKLMSFYKVTSLMGVGLGGIGGFVVGVYKTESNYWPPSLSCQKINYIFSTTAVGAASGLIYPITFPYYLHKFGIINDFKNLFKN